MKRNELERPVKKDDGDCGFSWHHRTIRHIDSRFPDEEPYETVHEFSFTGEEYDRFSFSIATAMSKEEAQWIRDAYDYPPVIEVDEADFEFESTSLGDFPRYKKHKWLNKTVKEKYMEIRLMTEEEKAQAKTQEMLEYWGERCKDFDGSCIACHAWKHFDETGEIAK